ncbi:MAG: hypothetical protein WBG73_20395 [Coleofasciculaceae cyanobacterium]
MNFLSRNSVKGSQWNAYKQLEQIPDTVSNPNKTQLTPGLNVFWRPLLALLIDELVEEQRVEYLDRCWSLNEPGQKSRSNSLQRFWELIK